MTSNRHIQQWTTKGLLCLGGDDSASKVCVAQSLAFSAYEHLLQMFHYFFKRCNSMLPGVTIHNPFQIQCLVVQQILHDAT